MVWGGESLVIDRDLVPEKAVWKPGSRVAVTCHWIRPSAVRPSSLATALTLADCVFMSAISQPGAAAGVVQRRRPWRRLLGRANHAEIDQARGQRDVGPDEAVHVQIDLGQGRAVEDEGEARAL